MMTIEDLTKNIRKRCLEFRIENKDEYISPHLSSVEIAVSLVEFALEIGREIQKKEEAWFRAGYHISLVLDNSEWQDISDMYNVLVDEVEKRNFFRKNQIFGMF